MSDNNKVGTIFNRTQIDVHVIYVVHNNSLSDERRATLSLD